ncbi:MAG TPA: sigma-54 dependent transcriptional regulator [Candidatus Krumholzibacteria bacterium]|nr:sigma-54 dependent transcriptional regulator [Candidatus Krumholzibacteria bacterium]
MKPLILLVDDQDSIRYFLSKTLVEEGYEVRTAATATQAVETINSELPDLVLLDLKLPDRTGLQVLAELKDVLDEICVIMMTAFGDIKTAVEAMKLGAYDYVNKPINLEQLLFVIDKGLKSRELARELLQLRRRHKLDPDTTVIPSQSPSMQAVYNTVQQVAKSDSTTVLIEGESGTGKDVIANMIHRMSARHDLPFMEINCASLPEELLESELFGHEKGAFTDAKSQKLGLMELANRGTLFLDEIGEMSLTIQVKLLRVLERMSFKRVGGTKDITVNVRIISATNRNLAQAVEQKTFREDLYYRLKVVPVFIPPLRERKEDILVLTKHFLHLYNKQFRKNFQNISQECAEMLLNYPWPGNIRELKNMLERVVLLEDGETLLPPQLPIAGQVSMNLSAVRRLENVLARPLPEDGVDFDRLMSDVEIDLIVKASRQCNWNQSRTAELLQMKRDKLRYRMKIYDINTERKRGPGRPQREERPTDGPMGKRGGAPTGSVETPDMVLPEDPGAPEAGARDVGAERP